MRLRIGFLLLGSVTALAIAAGGALGAASATPNRETNAIAAAGAPQLVDLVMPGSQAEPPAQPARAPERWHPAPNTESVIGSSQGGRPLTVYHLGDSPWPVLILGAQHGGPEANTARLVWQLLDYFLRNPDQIPSSLRLDIIPEANPDGLAIGSRQFLSDVDPNRNWGGPSWAADAQDSNGIFRLGLGGSEPFSEPETQALRDFIFLSRPVFTINYHSRGGFLFGGGGSLGTRVADTYATTSGYFRAGGGGTPGGGGGAASVLGYRATGAMNPWLAQEGYPAMLIELATATDSEFSRNLAALQRVLAILNEPSV